MTLELVLLLVLFVFVGKAFVGNSGPAATFRESGPKLGARIEQQITIGNTFKHDNESGAQWRRPPGGGPKDEL